MSGGGMNHIARKKRVRSGIRDDGAIRCAGHLKWIRGHECCAHRERFMCEGRIEAHHLQSYRAIEGGMGLKVGDDKCVPLCGYHHTGIHMLGQSEFERRFTAPLEPTAADLWKTSPHGIRYRAQRSAK